ERVSGKSWADFVEERIMWPLGMKNSAATYGRLKDLSDVSDPHNLVNGKVQVIPRDKLEVAEAAGGIYSNIPEMCTWMQTLLNRGKYGEGMSQTLISENVHRDLWTPQTILPVGPPGPYNTHFSAYALGFGVSDVSGYKQVSHSGGVDGFVTYVLMIPELNFGVIVLTNQMEGYAYAAIANQIKDGYLGKKGTDWVADLSSIRKKSLDQAKTVTDAVWRDIDQAQKSGKSSVDPNFFAGRYTDPWFGDVTISIKNGKLWFDSKRSPKLNGELLPYKGNTFVVKWEYISMPADAFVNFRLDE